VIVLAVVNARIKGACGHPTPDRYDNHLMTAICIASAPARLPFWFAAALSLANAAYGFFILPDSLERDQRRAIVVTPRQSLRSAEAVAFASRVAWTWDSCVPQHACWRRAVGIYVLYGSDRY
jgi:hypothetical protein